MTQRRPASDGSVVVATRFSTDPDPRGPFDIGEPWSDEARLLIFGVALCQAVSASLNTFNQPHSAQGEPQKTDTK